MTFAYLKTLSDAWMVVSILGRESTADCPMRSKEFSKGIQAIHQAIIECYKLTQEDYVIKNWLERNSDTQMPAEILLRFNVLLVYLDDHRKRFPKVIEVYGGLYAETLDQLIVDSGLDT